MDTERTRITVDSTDAFGDRRLFEWEREIPDALDIGCAYAQTVAAFGGAYGFILEALAHAVDCLAEDMEALYGLNEAERQFFTAARGLIERCAKAREGVA